MATGVSVAGKILVGNLKAEEAMSELEGAAITFLKLWPEDTVPDPVPDPASSDVDAELKTLIRAAAGQVKP